MSRRAPVDLCARISKLNYLSCSEVLPVLQRCTEDLSKITPADPHLFLSCYFRSVAHRKSSTDSSPTRHLVVFLPGDPHDCDSVARAVLIDHLTTVRRRERSRDNISENTRFADDDAKGMELNASVRVGWEHSRHLIAHISRRMCHQRWLDGRSGRAGSRLSQLRRRTGDIPSAALASSLLAALRERVQSQDLGEQKVSSGDASTAQDNTQQSQPTDTAKPSALAPSSTGHNTPALPTVFLLSGMPNSQQEWADIRRALSPSEFTVAGFVAGSSGEPTARSGRKPLGSVPCLSQQSTQHTAPTLWDERDYGVCVGGGMEAGGGGGDGRGGELGWLRNLWSQPKADAQPIEESVLLRDGERGGRGKGGGGGSGGGGGGGGMKSGSPRRHSVNNHRSTQPQHSNDQRNSSAINGTALTFWDRGSRLFLMRRPATARSPARLNRRLWNVLSPHVGCMESLVLVVHGEVFEQFYHAQWLISLERASYEVVSSRPVRLEDEILCRVYRKPCHAALQVYRERCEQERRKSARDALSPRLGRVRTLSAGGREGKEGGGSGGVSSGSGEGTAPTVPSTSSHHHPRSRQAMAYLVRRRGALHGLHGLLKNADQFLSGEVAVNVSLDTLEGCVCEGLSDGRETEGSERSVKGEDNILRSDGIGSGGGGADGKPMCVPLAIPRVYFSRTEQYALQDIDCLFPGATD